MTNYVFDTYALIEIIKGNPEYEKYIDATIAINDFILSELCYSILKEKDTKSAYEITDKYAPFSLAINIKIIKEAMSFRYSHKKRNLSMTDCISYIQAKNYGLKFLTGDKQFENLPNVEFVR